MAAPTSAEEVVTKWGTVTRFNRVNYASFKETCRFALYSADALQIALGTKVAPNNLNTNAGRA